ncbi:type III PLP-dependent enzyme [Parafrankia sp. BMG5.11]|uniref:type III PLP-dependent enzyme n=1 Tax=Parafrankia sp. BMG5.11 TaxID=222540 RepID=UPI00103D5A3A|nr:type III PLP-dependent enzyme [Parafrankia sp. BMG5.11]TCJ32505.1 type III PLP-dependent enzyme [Parafrankia sp. BMG5.11]
MLDLPISAAPLRALGPDRLPAAVLACLREWPARRGEIGGYLYSPAVAAARAAELRRHLPDWAELLFAVKANAFPPILDALLAGTANTDAGTAAGAGSGARAGTGTGTGTGSGSGSGRGDGAGAGAGIDGFEVSSAHELALAAAAVERARQRGAVRAAGQHPSGGARLVASGPGKSVSLLRALLGAVPAGGAVPAVDVVNAESPLELRRIDAVAAETGRRAAVALRVNPARVGLSGSLRMGGRPTAFGIQERDVPAAVELARSLQWIDLVGFHVHAVSGNLDATAHLDYVRWCLDFAVRQARLGDVDLRVVDVGGGLGVPFEPDRLGERPFDLDVFGAGLDQLRPPTGVRVVFEPGRALVADCGWYAAEVTDVKLVHGGAFAVLRGGIHHFQLPTSWEIVHNFAVVPRDDWLPGWPRPEVAAGPVTVVGELCTPEDTLARDVTVDRLRAGDVVVFPMAGAYGYEFAMHEFLGHPRAHRVVVDQPGTGTGLNSGVPGRRGT